MVALSNSALPRVGLGMAALGRPGYINLDRSSVFGAAGSDGRKLETMQSRAESVMEALMVESAKRGENSKMALPWFDCARSYGLSEKFVGEFLRSRTDVKPDDVYVSSKWGYTYVADWKVELGEGEPHEVKDHSVENFLKQMRQTEALIGDYVNLYQVHSATFESGILTDERAHEALSKCRKERGWSIGLSVSGPAQDEILRKAMSIKTSDGERLFDSVQCTFNVLEQRPGPALSEAREAGMDIIIKEGLANGRALRHSTIQSVSEKTGYPADALALGCILAQSFSPRVLSGAVTPEQLASNVLALDIAEKLRSDAGREILKEVMEGCITNTQQYWQDRSELAWN